MNTAAEIMEDVLGLPFADRSYLARKLLESLEDAGSLSDEEKATLERRSSEIGEGRVKAMGLEELKRDVETRLG